MFVKYELKIRYFFLEKQELQCYSVDPSDPECKLLASASKDGTVRIWNTVLNKTLLVLSGHTHSVTCVKWGGEGLLFTASQDRTIKVWRAKDVRALFTEHSCDTFSPLVRHMHRALNLL